MKRGLISIIALILCVVLLIVSIQFYLDTRRHLLFESIQAADTTRVLQAQQQDRTIINENIRSERETAITETIASSSPAITGIHVTRIQQYSNNPFFSDPFFSRFFPNNTYKKRIQSLG
ncbi:MAG: hypothetical protein J7M01_05085, partial [Candidatus Marinimicrobia bacterium]|nr:hypothetical protein [Candidatus Neomarinimicrobiota bacterium]